MREVFVAREGEIGDGERKVVADGEVEIGVFRVNGEFYAWDNDCPHQGGPVCQGRMIKGVEERLDTEMRSLGIHYADGVYNVVCPWHGYEFNICTGRHAGIPGIRLKGYPVNVRNGDIYVVIDS